jgi:hypothetical protein
VTLTFQILGFELARIELDIEQKREPIVETGRSASARAELLSSAERVVGKGVQTLSRWWVGRMFK